MTTFPERFKAATGYCPYAYQTEFATQRDLPSLVSGSPWIRRLRGSSGR